MKRLARFSGWGLGVWMLLLAAAMLLQTGAALAACTVTVINETGYDLRPLKFVQELGENKRVLGQVPMANGKSHTFSLKTGGQYRVYGLLTKDGETKYARGNLYSLKNGATYSLTLKKVVFSNEGSSVSFISREEFDNLR